MPKSALANSLTQITSSRTSRLSNCTELCRSYCRPGGPRHSTVKTQLDRRRAAKISVLTTANLMSNGPGRHVQHVKLTSLPDNRPYPGFLSSVEAGDGRDLGQVSARRDATMHRAMIAFGSNLGDRVSMIEQACEKMLLRGINVKATSSLYESAPMYVTDQEAFYNGVCEIHTTLNAHDLLSALQDIENELGRKRIIDKGPRNIDLDILLYDDQTISDERLNIPHKLMLEREFVLRPLAELAPRLRLPAPYDSRCIAGHLAALEKRSRDRRSLAVTQLAPNLPSIKADDPQRRTLVMAILNVTPDSFSDGGVHILDNTASLESTIRRFISSGASIIDVGGQSTRPNAEKISLNEELSRVLPAVKLIRSMADDAKVAISVDTFYAGVAKAAIEAGADIINDVSAGMVDPDMLDTVSKLRKTIIMMHMRGNPSTMSKMTSYPEGIIQGVGQELGRRVDAALAAGIPRWRIVLDPGIGFAKTQPQNLELLRRLDHLRVFPRLQGFAWLVGTSRKGFIGKVTGVKKVSERIWGTATAVTASVHGGADIVRVHDVAEMKPVVEMADAIFRSNPHSYI